ncbi:tetratricopeptide repeat protein [Roseateles sp. DC23W]|uniref:Tetratricopeptide repeat protein n=1 Tax=Pelomonas dachongensis TaxID=3299029 RepID=A0ABW7EIJ3_9BURK
MPLIGGLYFLIALLCAVHAVRSGQPLYWLLILFMFPFLGSVVYLFAVYLPNSRVQRSATRSVSAVARAMDPGRDVREARAALEVSPTAQHQMRLAEALLASGDAAEAARIFESTLSGPFANDPDMRFGAARAHVACERFDAALPHLIALLADRPGFRPDQVLLLLARSHAGTGNSAAAREHFEAAVSRHASFEAHAEYLIWALDSGDTVTATRLQAEADRQVKLWNAGSRHLNEPVMQRLRAAQARARKAG